MVKLMTAEIVFHELKEGRLHLDDTFHVSEHAWRTGGAHAHGTATFLDVQAKCGSRICCAASSSSPATTRRSSLAEGMAGTEEDFADRMNKRAAELGLAHSNFVDPWGRDDPAQHVDRARHGALAAHIIREYPDYYHYFGEKEFTWNKIRQLNRNPLLGAELGADGLKTGDAPDSGFGLVGSAVAGRAAADRRRRRPQDGAGTRRGGAQAARVGLSLVRAAAAVPARRRRRHARRSTAAPPAKSR